MWQFIPLKSAPVGAHDETTPLVMPFNVSAVEAKNFLVAVKVSSVAGGGPTYATGQLQTTFDNVTDGTETWREISQCEKPDITAAGVYVFHPTAISDAVGVRCRFVLTPAAGQSIVVDNVRKSFISDEASGPDSVSAPTGTAPGGSVDIASPIGPDTQANSVSVTLATDEDALPLPTGQQTMANSTPVTIASNQSELPLSKGQQANAASYPATISSDQFNATRGLLVNPYQEGAWPYVAWDYLALSWTPGTFTEVYTYRSGGAGGAVVGTVTVIYTDATRAELANVTYSPTKRGVS